MQIITNHKKFLTALRIVERVVSKNISLPILNSVLLKAEKNQLKLLATNLEIGIKCWVGAKTDKEGEIAVPARVFSDFVSNISDEKIGISSDKNILSISSEHYKTKILGMDTKDFPIIPKFQKDQSIKINPVDLRAALISVIDSAAMSETRPELSGVFVNISKNKVEFAATDSFRLAEKIIGISSDFNKSFIIPRNTVMEIIRIAESMEGDLTLAVSDNQLFIGGEEFELVSRLIDGRYPDYKRVIPDKFISLAKVDKKELEKNTRMAGIFTSSILDIKLSVGKGEMEILAKNSDRGEINATLACDLKNQPFDVSVNYHYLLDGLKVMPTDSVVLEFTGDGSPLVIRGENIKDQVYVIMPLRS